MALQIKPFFHQASSTISYIVFDDVKREAAVIDTVYDFNLSLGEISTEFVDQQIAFIREHCLTLIWILETHAHADHLTGAAYLQSQLGGKIGIGEGIKSVQSIFKQRFNISDSELQADGLVFDHLFKHNETFLLGEFVFKVMATPGHTNDSVCYLIGQHAFVGDTLFLPDVGSARCDFPGGNAKALFNSVAKIHQLPDDTTLWMCHDYPATVRDVAYSIKVKDSKLHNIHLGECKTVAEFVELRTKKDQKLAAPKLLYPAIQLNIRAGRLPQAENNEHIYFKIPLNIRNKHD